MGKSHPHTIAHGCGARLAYDDPADRLGIRFGGIRNGDELEGWPWLMVDGTAEKSILRLSRLVNWLDGLDTEELRSRRWYLANNRIGRPRCEHAHHTLYAEEKWQKLQTQD